MSRPSGRCMNATRRSSRPMPRGVRSMTWVRSASSRPGGSAITSSGEGTTTSAGSVSGMGGGPGATGGADTAVAGDDAASAAASSQVNMAASSAHGNRPECTPMLHCGRFRRRPGGARRSVQRLQAQDRRQHRRQHRQFAAAVAAAMAVPGVVAVLVAAFEALAEVVGVLVVIQVAAVVAVAGVQVAVAAAHVVAPAVLAVGVSGLQAFAVTALNRLAHQLGAVVVGLVPAAAVVVAVARRRGVERVARVVPAGLAPVAFLRAQAGVVVALVAVPRHAALLLQRPGAFGTAPFGLKQPAFALALELFGAQAPGFDPHPGLFAVDPAAVRLGPAWIAGLGARGRLAGCGLLVA